jgi:hypothetical protein
MNDKVIELLTSLATSLRTTIEKLWAVYLQQALVTGVQTSIMFVIINILSFFAFKMFNGARLKAIENDKYGDNTPTVLLFTIIVLTVIIVWFDFMMISTIVTCFLNPSYWALEQILSKLH